MPVEAARLQVMVESKGAKETARDLKGVESAARGAESGINKLGSAGERLGRSGGFLPGLANVAQVINGLPAVGQLAHALVSPLMDAAEAGVKYNSMLENAQINLEGVTGSAEKAKERLAVLQAFAEKKTPFEFPGVLKATQYMNVFGFALDEQIPKLTSWGNAVAASGDISEETLQGVVRAFGQMRAKGKLSAEEMEQLAERGIPSWELYAKAIGKSVAEARKLVELGRVKGGPAVEAITAMIDADPRYMGQMERSMSTLTGRLSTLNDVKARSQGIATQALTSDINKTLDDLLKQQDLASKIATNINTAITPVSGIIRATASTVIGGNLTGGIKEGIDATKSAVYNAVTEMGLGAIIAMMKALGIMSPSKEFYKLGLMTGKGFALGLRDSLQEVEGEPERYLTREQHLLQTRYRHKLKTDKRFVGFEDKLGQVSKALGIDPNWLLNVIGIETAGTFDPAIQNPKSKATGLIQFMPEWSKAATARKVGTTVGDLKKMTATDQLTYVQKYFEMMGASGKMKNLADVYNVVAGNWKPGGGPDSVVYRQGSRDYAANKGWDKYRDGVITKSELGEVAYERGGGFGSPVKVEVINGREVWGTPGTSDMSAADYSATNNLPASSPVADLAPAMDIFARTNELLRDTASTSLDLSSVIVPRAIQASNALGEAALSSANAVQSQTKTAAEWYNEVVVQSEEATRRLTVQWDDVASGFEGVFSDSLDRALFENENFFREFSLSFTRLIYDLGKQALAANLGKLLFGFDGQQGSAGGGWLGKLLGWGVSALGSAFGGSMAGNGAGVGNLSKGAQTLWIPGRATGGDVYTGKAHWVGETGRELFVPTQNGRIFNDRQLAGLGQGQIVNHFQFHITAPGGDVPRSTQEQMARRMLDMLSHTQQRGG